MSQSSPDRLINRSIKRRASNHLLFSQMFGDATMQDSGEWIQFSIPFKIFSAPLIVSLLYLVPPDEDEFFVHRRMLRRRYIRKEQKEQAVLEELRRRGEGRPPDDSLHTQNSTEQTNQSTSSSHSHDVGQISPTTAFSGNVAPSTATNRSGPTNAASSCRGGKVDVMNIIVPPYSPLRCQKTRTLRF